MVRCSLWGGADSLFGVSPPHPRVPPLGWGGDSEGADSLFGVGQGLIRCSLWGGDAGVGEREFFIDNPLVRVHFIIVMIRWTGLAPWEFEFLPATLPLPL